MTIAVKNEGKQNTDLKPSIKSSQKVPPPLENGAHLSRAEFERRYEAMSHLKRAELIEGVAFMSSPVHHLSHGNPHMRVIGWLALYYAATPGVDSSDNATVRLDADNEVQPDVLLRIETALGGTSHISIDDYIEGAPELIVEIAASSASYDLHEKKKVYRRNGVQEYVVWTVYDEELQWFQLLDGEYQQLVADEDGLIRSQVFPGLHLDVEALLTGDLAAVLAAVSAGVETEAHAVFVENLRSRA
jgi:Uma2 family endonuclease